MEMTNDTEPADICQNIEKELEDYVISYVTTEKKDGKENAWEKMPDVVGKDGSIEGRITLNCGNV